MKPEDLAFVRAVGQLRLTGPDRSFAIAAAVASSVADYTEVPAVALDSSSTAFIKHAASQIRNMIGYFNEVAAFDMRKALELARKFWMTRYETVHVRRLHDAVDGDYFQGYFNVGRNFAKEDIVALNAFSIQINALEVILRSTLEKSEMARGVEETQSGAMASMPGPDVVTAVGL